MMNQTRVAPVLGSIPSGLFVVTIRKGAEKGAFLASWVQQASFHPPLITVAMAKDRPIRSWFQPDTIFGRHVRSSQHKKLLKHFAKPPETPSQVFTHLSQYQSMYGIPVLTESMAMLHCRVKSTTDAGDHELVLGEVFDAETFDLGKPKVHIRKNGFQY